METPPEATLAGFDIRTPRAGRPMSQVVAILTPRPRPVCSLGDASLIEPSLTHPSSQSEHASRSAR